MTHEKTQSAETFEQQALEMIIALAGGEEDKAISRFFTGLAGIWDDPVFERVRRSIWRQRPNLTQEHFPYLLMAASQCVSDMRFDAVAQWEKDHIEKEIIGVLTEHESQITKLCQEKNVSTNNAERYVGLGIVRSLLVKSNTVDLGSSSLALGLRAMALPGSFDHIKITDPELRRLVHQPVEGTVAGIELNAGESPDLAWNRACLMPGYEPNRKLYDLLAANPIPVNVIKGDVLDIPSLPKTLRGQADIIHSSSFMYIIGETKTAALDRIWPTVKYLAAPQAFFVDADYRRWIDFAAADNPYSWTVRFVDDWEHPLEILESVSVDGSLKDSVMGIKKGGDWDLFVQRVNRLR